ncbi:kielin/chordin-like protein [Lingula anatina]|uniref:Kielin/chordin-like protein n=1 Tax=Lingula anatina TaxID=7574 RepID=A0A1S3HP30_LINAN|nr:kielin/chordin-like protein [Lingula anatina]|eukprot:XP_013387802.1 kielin/chordin-like protein [Lingula anatina]
MYATLAVVTALNSTHLTVTFSTTPPVVWVLDLTTPNATDILEENPVVGEVLVLHFKASPGDVVGVGNTQKLMMKFFSNFSGEHLTICSMPQGSCPTGQCIIRGDPHIKQFEGDQFLFSGFCRYILSETLPGAAEEFNITGTFVYNKPGSTRTMIQEVLIHVRNMTIEMTTDGIVKVDGVVVVAAIAPQDVGHGVMLYLDPKDFPRTVVDLRGVLKVELTTPVGALKRKGHRATINIPETYGGYLNGLCGNLNGDPTDDNNPCDGGPPADCFVDDDSCA